MLWIKITSKLGLKVGNYLEFEFWMVSSQVHTCLNKWHVLYDVESSRQFAIILCQFDFDDLKCFLCALKNDKVVQEVCNDFVSNMLSEELEMLVDVENFSSARTWLADLRGPFQHCIEQHFPTKIDLEYEKRYHLEIDTEILERL